MSTGPTELDYARLAAFIDGEGSVRFRRSSQKRGGEKWTACLSIANTDARLHVWLRSTFGGSVTWIDRKNPQWKPLGVWEITNSGAVGIIQHIRPYLICKGMQADTLLAFRMTYHGYGRGNPVPEVVRQERQGLKTVLTELNRRGTVHA